MTSLEGWGSTIELHPRSGLNSSVARPSSEPAHPDAGFTNERAGTLKIVAAPASPVLSTSQFATLAEIGEERTAAVGDVLYRVGDRRYPFIAIIEGEAAILDAAGNE